MAERTVRLSIDVPEKMRRKLKYAALRESVTVREYVTAALLESLRADDESGQK